MISLKFGLNSLVVIRRADLKFSSVIRGLFLLFVILIKENVVSQMYVDPKNAKYFCALSRIFLKISGYKEA